MGTHMGTHVDASSHFALRLASIDKIPAGRLVCSAVLIKVFKKANQLVGREDFAGVEIRQGDAVVNSTAWEKQATKKNYVTENPSLWRFRKTS